VSVRPKLIATPRVSALPLKRLSDDKLATVVAGQRPVDLTKQEAAAYDFASALVSGGVLPELTYKAALEQFGPHGAAELS
jgi:4-carboxymuconolactone decarboxylase